MAESLRSGSLKNVSDSCVSPSASDQVLKQLYRLTVVILPAFPDSAWWTMVASPRGKSKGTAVLDKSAVLVVYVPVLYPPR